MDYVQMLELAKEVFEVLSQVVMALAVIATTVVRLPWFKKHALDVEGASGKVVKAIQKLPSFGINPRTKALEEALKEVKGEKK